MLITRCDYSLIIPYDSSNNGTDQSLSFSGIQIDGVTYTDFSNPDFENQSAIQAFLDNLNIGITIIYIYSASDKAGSFTAQASTKVPQIIYMIKGITTPSAGPQEGIFLSGTSCINLYDPNVIRGCMDPTAKNYNALATEDDGSCTYKALDDVGKIRCCVAKKNAKFYLVVKAGMLPEKQVCASAQMWYDRKAVELLESFTAIGTIIREPVVPQDEVMASTIIDFQSLLGSVLWVSIEASVDGVVILPNINGFVGGPYATWATLQDLVDVIVAWINGNVTVPDYTATNVGTTVTLWPIAGLGASVNGFIANFIGNAVKYSYRNIYQTNPLTVLTPNFGCYDPDRDEIWFGGLLTKLATVLDGSGNVITSLSFSDDTGQIIYNPLLQRKYVPLMNGPYFRRIDNNNTQIGGAVTVGALHSSVYYGAFNPVTNTFAFTCCATNSDNAIVVFHADGMMAETVLYDISLLATDNVQEIAYCPAAGPYYGYYVAACLGSFIGVYRVALVSTTGVQTYVNVMAGLTPIVVAFIEDFLGAGAGVYEMWVAGIGTDIQRFNPVTMTSLGSITMPVSMTCRSIKQDIVTGNIYITNQSPGAQIFIIRQSDGFLINPGMVITDAAQGSYDVIINPNTSKAYISMPFGGDNKVVELNSIEVDIDNNYTFTGGVNAIVATIPGIYSTEDDNCLTEEENEALKQEMLDKCSECCD